MNHKPRAIILIISVMMVALSLGTSTPAHAAELVPFGPSHSLGNLALNWAETHETGLPYVWAGAGPYGYDCSGGVMAAVEHTTGIILPHNTVAMIDSGKLIRVYHPQRGDLAMWGPLGNPYHVAFVTIWPDMGFGPLQSGTPIGWYSWAYWPPSAFYRII